MASNSTELSRFLARTTRQARIAAVLLGGAVLAFTTIAAAADPFEVAVVESISSNISGVEIMDYLRTGQVIQLRPDQTIVLSYETSCVRETITGGTVTVGIDRSLVVSGQIRRFEGPCDAPSKMVLTSEHSEIAIAGRTFRGGSRR
jgi:hypothetical protein